LAQFTNQTKFPPVTLITRETILIHSAATAQRHLYLPSHNIQYSTVHIQYFSLYYTIWTQNIIYCSTSVKK